MKLKKIASAALSVFVFLTTLGHAEEISTTPGISYDRVEGTVQMNGYTLTDGAVVTIEILYPEKTSEDLGALNSGENEENAGEVVRYLAQAVSDENNYWEKSFYFGAETGSYPVRIYLTDEAKLYTDTLEFVSAAEIQEIIEKINGNSDKTEEIIEANISALGFDSPLYLLIKSGASLTKGYERIAAEVPYDDIDDLSSSFEKNMVIGAFNSTLDSQVAAQIFTGYSDLFGITDEKAYKNYLELNDIQKKELCDMLDGEGYNNLSDISSAFIEKSVFYTLINISEWNRVATVAKEYQDDYGEKLSALKNLNLTDYNALGGERQYNLIQELKASAADSLDAWVNTFNDLVVKWRATNIGSQGSSGGGGSGSGGGSTTSGVGNISAAIQQTIAQQAGGGTGVKFTDLDNAPWAKEAILDLSEKGIVSGKGDNYFDTNSNVTRAEFVKMLVSAFDLLDVNAVSGFTDADEDSWYYKYLASAEKKGIASGNGDGTFGVSRSITRQEMASMLYRTIELCDIETDATNETVDFTDVDEISDWAKKSVYTLAQAGIINGMEDGRFAPFEHTTRAQAAMVIYMTMQRG